ncbi:hypothetical protein MMC25_002647 [Agyrium rufum]|nr:hypothetical protein [Agyrium rufum]
MLYLLLQSHPSNNPFPSLTADHLASHVGKACGIVNILRGVPLLAFPPPPNHHSNNPSGASPLGRGGAGLGGVQDSLGGRKTPGFVNLPLDVMADANLREEDVLRQGASAPGLKDAVFRVATRASDHLITTRTMLGNLRKGEDVGHDFEYEGVEGYADYGHDAEYAGLSREESGRSKGRRFDSDAYRQEVLGGEMDATFNNFGDDASSISSTPAQTGRKVAGRGVSKEQKQLQEVETLFPFLLPGVAAQLWLERLEKVDFDVFDPSLRRSDWKLPWRYWRANSKKKI